MNSAPLRLAPDLRRALDQLPKPDGVPAVRVTIEVAAGEAGRTATSVVEFHRGVLSTPEDNEPVWVYEGSLALDRAATPADHAPARVAMWLHEQLGPRCLAVDVRDVAEHEATVRIAATIGGAAALD